MIKTLFIKRLLSLVFFILLLIFSPTKTKAAGLNCYLDNLDDNAQATGWALNEDNSTWTTGDAVDLHFYIDGTYPQGTFSGYTTANINNGWTIHGFKYTIPQLKDGKPHMLFVYAVDNKNNLTKLCGAVPKHYPRTINNAYFLQPNYPGHTSWAADNVNYFQKWSCSSPTGINNIRKLDIIPSGKHYPYMAKDSTMVAINDVSDGHPVIHFTTGVHSSYVNFDLKKAVFDGADKIWKIVDVLAYPDSNSYGISSQDGTNSDYVMNIYSAPGWGPAANKPGSQSKIPGVSETPFLPGFSGYLLWGTGPLGLTTMIKGNPALGQSCIHMNPTLFDYDNNGVPHSFAVTMWNFGLGTDKPCAFPSGSPITQLPDHGNYVYRYKDATVGWQFDINGRFTVKGDAVNYVPKSDSKFLISPFDSKTLMVDLKKPVETRFSDVLNCPAGSFIGGEPSGYPNHYFFIGSENKTGLPTYYPNGLIFDWDIFEAYSSTTLGDFNFDDSINIQDYNLMKSKFNNPFTLYDYNNLVTNYLK